MNIPPLILYDENEAILKILQAIASKEEALAVYANAEAKRIHALIDILSKTEYLKNNSPLDVLNLKQNALSALGAAQSIQLMLESSLQVLVDYLGIESMGNLVPLSSSSTCQITAQGKGRVTTETDSFFGGQAHLIQAHIAMDKGTLNKINIHYRVNGSDFSEEFEAITDGLQVFFVDTITKKPSSFRPNISFVIGHGNVVKKTTSGIFQGKSAFALTIWDCGHSKKDKFRIVINSQENSALNHDSGVVV